MISFGDDPIKDVKFSDNVDLKKTEAIIDDYDKKMLNYIATLYEAINGEKLDFEKVKNAVDALSQFNKRQEYNYLNNLLHPEKCKCVKIPSPIPVPSCSFQLHNSYTLSTNSSGNLAFVFNPFFLSTNDFNNDYNSINSDNISDFQSFTASYYSSFFFCNNSNLNGADSTVSFSPMNAGQCIEPIYDQYRLVSASVVVKYIGRLDIVSGVIGGAIVFDDSGSIGGAGNLATTSVPQNYVTLNDNSIKKYGNFDLARDSYYHQENMCLEGLRMLYFPIDNSYEEYSKLMDPSVCNLSFQNTGNATLTTDSDYLKNGFKFMVYVQGAPSSSSCFKVDFYCNFECLPRAQYLNYLPLSMNLETTTPKEKKEAIMYIQKKPVMTLKEASDISASMAAPSIWDKMKTKFNNGLAPITKLMAQGLAKSIPFLKPAISLAGSMIGMDME